MPRSLSIDGRLLALLFGLLALLALVAGWLGWQRMTAQTSPGLDEVLHHPELRAEFLSMLAKRTGGEFDSHPDPALGHVSLFGDRPSYHGQLRVSQRGIREKDYALPKPPGTLRIVLLGDSFVFGWRVEEEQRLGVQLERYLRERGHGFAGSIEVLHLGVVGWGFEAECAFVLRQLAELQPDLVVQITLSNDLDDPQAIRGSGTLADFATRGAPGNSLVYFNHSRDVLRFDVGNLVPDGWGYESLSRFALARKRLAELRDELARLPVPAHYLLVVNWQYSSASFHEHLGKSFDPGSLFYLPPSFWEARECTFSASDRHWNPAGHQTVARILYALIRERGLLPALTLDPWPEAEQEARALGEEGWQAALKPPRLPRLREELVAHELTKDSARQVLGGLDVQGHVAPYASLLLGRRPSARELVVTGQFLPDPILRDEHVQVFLDELLVAELVVRPGEPFESRTPLPPELRGRVVLNVRFRAENFVYRGDDLRKCVVFQLERVAVE